MARVEGKNVKLVFYDLEWTQNEIIQIGAVCENSDFSQCIRPSGRIDPFVKKKIKLDVRKDPTGEWQVYDIVRKQFLHTVGPREGFEKFLKWLEDISNGSEVLMVSHGNADILVLDRNFARFDLDQRLYQIVTKYVDFQKYLAAYFQDISRLSLLELVKIFCNDQIFRLHCADEDSKALMSVFSNMHQMRGVSSQTYMRNIDKLKKVYVKSVTIPKSSKEIKDIANHLNPDSKYVLLSSIYGVYNIFVASPLFKVIEHPENFKFEVSGYCVNHKTERYASRNYANKSEDEYKERTRLDIACHIGNAYFILTHHIQAGAKSQFNLVRKEGTGKRTLLTTGSPVSVMILVTSTNFVKVDDITVNYDKKPVDINRILTGLQKKQTNTRSEDGWGSVSSGASNDSNQSKVDSSSSSNNSNNRATHYNRRQPNNPQNPVEVETDSTILTRRKKQLEYCKRTDDYKVYIEEIPKQQRRHSMPKTPDMSRKYSRRQWDGAVKKWKTHVHAVGRDLAKRSPSTNEDKPSKENANPNKSNNN